MVQGRRARWGAGPKSSENQQGQPVGEDAHEDSKGNTPRGRSQMTVPPGHWAPGPHEPHAGSENGFL